MVMFACRYTVLFCTLAECLIILKMIMNLLSVVFSVGAILAGLPFSYMAKQLEWQGAFVVLEILLIGVLIMKIVMRKVEYKMVPTRKKLQ